MASSLAKKVPSLRVVCLLRDAELCRDINERHCNTRYLSDFTLPPNVSATTSPKDAIEGAQLAIHAVPVQHSRAFLQGISALVPPDLPIVCLSKGLEVESGLTMADVIPSALGRKQPCAFLSGPSFAREVMEVRGVHPVHHQRGGTAPLRCSGARERGRTHDAPCARRCARRRWWWRRGTVR